MLSPKVNLFSCFSILYCFKHGHLSNSSVPLWGEIDTCAHRVFCMKLNFQKLLLQAFLHIIGSFGSDAPQNQSIFPCLNLSPIRSYQSVTMLIDGSATNGSKSPNTLVEVATLITVYRLPRRDQKTLEMGHGTIWKKIEKVDDKFAITKYHTTPRYSLDKPYGVIIPTRKVWEEDWPEQLSKGQVWFIDGDCN